MQSGIYKISNIVDGKIYIGSAVDLAKRRNRHLHYLRKGCHHSPHLQRAFNKFGEINFTFDVIEYCEPDALIQREQAAFDKFSPHYNVEKVAGSRRGRGHSVETRARMSASQTGKINGPPSIETRNKISAAQLGKKRGPYRPRTAEHCAAISAALTGKKFGPRRKKANSEA